MKTIIMMVLALWSVVGNAQEKDVVVDKIRIGTASANFRYTVNLAKMDTFNFFTFVYIDERYPNLKPYESMIISWQPELDTLKSFLGSALETLGTKTNMTWSDELFTVQVYQFSSLVHITNRKDRSYFTIGRANTKKLIDFLDTYTMASNVRYLENMDK
jgi:hypothetical protein